MNHPQVGPAWKCHAKPAKLYGNTCGHPNLDGGRLRGETIFCRGCGMTKNQSDARLERKERQKLKITTANNTGLPSSTFHVKMR